jgi:hypothetical protein
MPQTDEDGRLRKGGGGVAVAVLLALVPACDHFRVESFHGAKVLLDVEAASPTAAGHHVEIWVRDAADDTAAGQNVVRLLASDGDILGPVCDPKQGPCTRVAWAFVPVLGPWKVVIGDDGHPHAELQDGCMIDENGNVVWSPDALDPATGQPQSAQPTLTFDDKVKSNWTLQKRIDELTINTAMVAMVPWDDHSGDMRPTLADTPDTRKAACHALWRISPAIYSGNPRQTTAPVHGALAGVSYYLSTGPPQILGGIAFSTAWSLPNPKELWLTDTAATVDMVDPAAYDCGVSPTTCRGTVMVDGTATTPGRGAVHFELRAPFVPGPFASLSGSATLEIALDETPAQF